MGHTAAINCLAFSCDSNYLVSGGDNGAVQIWNLGAYKCLQTIHDRGGKWGQITCVKWLGPERGVVGESLCFETGRGMALIYSRPKAGVCITFLSTCLITALIIGQGNFLELSST